MSPDESAADTGAEPKDGAGTHDAGTGRVTGLRLASAVMFVTDLGRSVTFYEELLGWHVTVSDESVALLVGPEGFQLYLRAMSPRTQHPSGFIGIQYLSWTASDEADLQRCEDALRRESTRVRKTAGDGFTLLEGHGPDGVPVLVTFPGPDQVPRHEIKQRIYAWRVSGGIRDRSPSPASSLIDASAAFGARYDDYGAARVCHHVLTHRAEHRVHEPAVAT